MDIELFQVLSFSAKAGHEASLREKATLDITSCSSFFPLWLSQTALQEDSSLVYLATCHRVEIYLFACDTEKFLKLWFEMEPGLRSRVDIFSGMQAYGHLIKVGSSLESEVLGETQITGQLKKAIQQSREQFWLKKGRLLRIFECALRAIKRIRRETLVGSGTLSVAHIAIDGLGDFFEDLSEKPILIVGAGSMAIQSIERLIKMKAERLIWMNRTRSKIEAHSLAKYCTIADFQDLYTWIWKSSVSVFAVSSHRPLVYKEELQRIRKQLGEKDLGPYHSKVVLDLGLPRNVDSCVHGYANFYLRNVDEFSTRAESTEKKRSSELLKAEKILKEEEELFLNTWDHWDKSQVLAQLHSSIENFIEQELQRLGLEKDAKIGYVTRGLFARLLHQLTQEVEGVDEPGASMILDTLVRAWRQQSQWSQKRPQNSQEPKNLALK